MTGRAEASMSGIISFPSVAFLALNPREVSRTPPRAAGDDQNSSCAARCKFDKAEARKATGRIRMKPLRHTPGQ